VDAKRPGHAVLVSATKCASSWCSALTKQGPGCAPRKEVAATLVQRVNARRQMFEGGVICLLLPAKAVGEGRDDLTKARR